MKWIRYSIKTVSDAADLIAASLYDLGIEGVEIEEERPPAREDLEEMFADFIPDYENAGDGAVIHFYLEPGEDTKERLAEVTSMLEELKSFSDIGEASVSVSETEDKDWQNSWKEFFHKFTVDDILIVPSWESAGDDDHYSLKLNIDPGTAFGTGMHETTKLAIRGLRKQIRPDDRLLDIGTGSGILGIIALKSGAAYVKATDIDPNAVGAVKDNLVSNQIDDGRFDLVIGNVITDETVLDDSDLDGYDIATANILADVLIPLAGVIGKYLKPNALLITSGILEDKKDAVAEALVRNGFEIAEVTSLGEWVSVTARRKA